MKRYTFNPITRTLVMSADFARAISVVGSDEYNLFIQMRAEIPDLKVERKTHASPISYKGTNGGKRTSYYPTKKLTYERMEKFMNALPEGQKYLDKYHKLREKAKEMGVSAYAPCAHWFMEQFPEYRNNPLFYINEKNLPNVIDFTEFLKSIEEKAS